MTEWQQHICKDLFQASPRWREPQPWEKPEKCAWWWWGGVFRQHPVPADSDFYLHCGAYLMVGGICSQQELHSRAGYLTFQRSSQLIIALPSPGVDHPAPLSSQGLARGLWWLCSWVTLRGPEMGQTEAGLRSTESAVTGGWSPGPFTQHAGQGQRQQGSWG